MRFYVLTAPYTKGVKDKMEREGVPAFRLTHPNAVGVERDLLPGYMFVPVTWELKPRSLPLGFAVMMQNDSPVVITSSELDVVRLTFASRPEVPEGKVWDFLVRVLGSHVQPGVFPRQLGETIHRVAVRRGGHWVT